MARPRRSRKRQQPYVPLDVERISSRSMTVQFKHGIEWSVQPVASHQAVKEYVCPGCAGGVKPGTAHVVVWRHDSIMGEAAALAERRHWHSGCWRAA